MCRVLAYLGRPMSLEHLLFATDSSLVRQAYSPRFMSSFLNLAGFGMAVWDEGSRSPATPLIVKHAADPALGLTIAVDQSFNVLCLLGPALVAAS
jgi:hypothetical protein